MKDYTQLGVWLEARKLTSGVYAQTRLFPKEELFALTNQMRRSVVSVPSNIAEGCGRNHPKESLQFFFIARGSLYELETQLYIALDQKYILTKDFELLRRQLIDCRKILSGFISYYQTLATGNR